MSRRLNKLMIENAKIIWRNFAGEQTQFNRSGARNFCVLFDDLEMAERLADDGWNIKFRESKEDGERYAFLQVAVSYANVPPKVVLIAGRKQTVLDESTISTLDYAEIANVDLIINPYNWEANGKTGVKAYLKTMYVTIEEDVFASKYSTDDGYDDGEPIPFN